jgi:hypothetical protein
MEISHQLLCECNNKIYKSLSSLKSHQKTQGHVFWESNREQKQILIKINRLENENDHLRRLNILLMERLKNLEIDLKN